MARIKNIDLPKNKRIVVALTYIYGIGPSRAHQICTDAKVSEDTRTDNLTVEDIIARHTIILNAEDESLGYKYAYLNNSITYSPEYTGKILKGDLLLYDSNCIVLYYQDMDTDKVYTKIGHVDNLDTLEFGPIDIIIKAK